MCIQCQQYVVLNTDVCWPDNRLDVYLYPHKQHDLWSHLGENRDNIYIRHTEEWQDQSDKSISEKKKKVSVSEFGHFQLKIFLGV